MSFSNKLKNIIIFFVMISISANVFAVAVSDNDGSAFITKAEYDSLKNSFQTQLDFFNTQIDSKIDNAIASYLSGITINTEPTNYWTRIQEASGGKVCWGDRMSTGDENLTSQVNLSVIRELTEKYGRPQTYGWWNATGSYRWDATNKRVVTSGGTQYTPSNGNYWIRHFVNATSASGTDIRYFDLIDFGGQYGGRISGYNGTASTAHTWQIPNGTAWTGSATSAMQAEIQTYYSSNNNTSEGSGTRWEVHKSLTGKNILRTYYTSYYPILCFTVWDHIYYDNNTIKSAFENNGRGYSTQGNAIAPLLSDWGTITNGNPKITKDDPNYTTSSNYVEVKGMINRIAFNRDWSVFMFTGDALNTQIYYSYDDAKPYRVGSDLNDIETPESEFYDLYHEPKGELLQTNKIAKYKLQYQNYNVEWTRDYPRDFYNEYVSQVVGEDVYVGQGVKLCKIENENVKTYTVKIKFSKINDAGDTQVNWVLTNKKFNKDGTIPSGATIYKDETSAYDTEYSFELTLDPQEELWVNLQAPNHSNVTISSFDIKLK